MKLVIFDCDGVLINSEVIFIAAELKFLKEAGLEYERRQYMKDYTGMPYDAWRLKLAVEAGQRLGEPLAEGFFEGLNDYVSERLESDLTVISGVRETILSLDLGRCVASSTGNEGLHWKLGHTGLADLFTDAVFSGDMVSRGKPEPDLFLHAANVMDVAAQHCLVVEDSCNGVLAGKAAGMVVIGFSGGDHCLDEHEDDLMQAGADRVIDTFADLKPTIAQFI
jgi:HAD superfamily hydrolase (TIGR01509 family)